MNNTSITYNVISVYCQKIGTVRQFWLERFEVSVSFLQSMTITPMVKRLLLLQSNYCYSYGAPVGVRLLDTAARVGAY